MSQHNEHTIGEVLQQMMKQYHLDHKANEVRLQSQWKEIVGAPIARFTRKLWVKDGVLFVNLTNATLKQELAYNKDSLIRLVNNHLGERVIDDIVLR